MGVEQHQNAMKHAAEPTNIHKEASFGAWELIAALLQDTEYNDFIRSNSFLYRSILPLLAAQSLPFQGRHLSVLDGSLRAGASTRVFLG